MRETLALLLLAGAASASEPAPRRIALGEAFGLALQRSETLAQKAEAVAELEALAAEARSGILPSFALKGGEFYQDEAPGEGGVASTFNKRSRPEAKVSLHQPLFSGLREFLALKGARTQREAGDLDYRRASDLLYLDVARAYVDLLALQQEIRIRDALLAIHSDRIKELEHRRGLGRSRESEVLAERSRLARLAAQRAAARGRERVAQEVLRFLTGLTEELAPEDLAPPSARDLEPLVLRARERADVEARRREREVARLSFDAAKRARWPVIGLDGNYYLHRVGFQKDIRWDLNLAGELPLFSGGAVSAGVDKAAARLRSAEQAFSLARRLAEKEASSARRDLESALEVTQALEGSLALAEADAQAQASDYRLGLVTNLDVLGSLDGLQEARLELSRARLDAVLARAGLDTAAGLVPAPGGGL